MLLAVLQGDADDVVFGLKRCRLDLTGRDVGGQIGIRVGRLVASGADQLLREERKHDHHKDRERCTLEEATHLSVVAARRPVSDIRTFRASA